MGGPSLLDSKSQHLIFFVLFGVSVFEWGLANPVYKWNIVPWNIILLFHVLFLSIGIYFKSRDVFIKHSENHLLNRKILEPIKIKVQKMYTLQGTNISSENSILKMILLFPKWDVLVP